MRAPLLLTLSLGAFGCVPSAAQPPPDDAAAAPAPLAGRVTPSEGERGCAFIEKVAPIPPGPGVPRVFAPVGVTVKDVRADLKLSADGAISLLFDLELANAGGGAAEALVGYAFRTPGGRIAARLGDRVTFAEGLAAVQLDAGGKHGYIDPTGALVIQPQFAQAGPFSEGLAPVEPEPESDFGFIDSNGARLRGSQKLLCELTIKNGRIVYDLNGLARDDWDKLPVNYGPQSDAPQRKK